MKRRGMMLCAAPKADAAPVDAERPEVVSRRWAIAGIQQPN